MEFISYHGHHKFAITNVYGPHDPLSLGNGHRQLRDLRGQEEGTCERGRDARKVSKKICMEEEWDAREGLD